MDEKKVREGGVEQIGYLPYGHQWIDEEDIKAVVEILRSDWITTGPKIAEFEETFAGYVGAKYAIAVSAGTAALHLTMITIGCETGSEVITTSFTFAATANCVLYQGGRPVFVDIEPRTYNIDPQKLEEIP